jgi:hypothetical protein
MHKARSNFCYLSLKSGFLLCSLRLFGGLTSEMGILLAPFKASATILEKLRASLVTPEPCCQDLNSSKALDIVTHIKKKANKKRSEVSSHP